METPVYLAIARELEREITEGGRTPGDKLPTEAELCAAYHVARGTARQAVAELCARGLAHREHGRGTFVSLAPAELHLSPGRFLSILEELSESGATFRTTKATLTRERPETALRRRLALGGDEDALLLKRVRVLAEKPVMVSENWLSAARFGGLADNCPDFTEGNLALYEVLRCRYDTAPTAAERSFSAVAADTERSGALMIPIGAPLLLVEQLTLDAGGRPLDFAKIWVRSELVHLSTSMRR